ncbi:MAG TPA: hypothetical protein VKX17_07640 [Planctomycetota bacterium]|nr:hypothetical protein [Planctomycetota bacterium]
MMPISLDACCIINICATGDAPRILKMAGMKFYLSAACSKESLCLHGRDDKAARIRVPIDLSPLIQSRLIELTDVTPGPETAAFVDFAKQLDDGEAMALALAICRGWTFASDDRKACRIAKEKGVPTIGTPGLLHTYSTSLNLSPPDIARCLKNIEQRATFRPKPTHPLGHWWRANSNQ